MMYMKSLYVVILALALCAGADARNLVILHLNDTHSHVDPIRSGKYGGMGGAFEQAMYVDSVRRAEVKRNVLLRHAGDFSQGTSYFTELEGNIEIDLLNAFRYDAVCLGKHEFDNGMDELARRLSSLKMPVLCANYDFSDTPLGRYVRPYSIIRRSGLKIGIVGLLTDLSAVVDSGIAAQLEFMDPVSTADRYAEYLKKERNCDLVICLTHLGYEGEAFTDRMLASSTKFVDIIVGGHSHTKLKSEKYVDNADGNDVVVVTDWKWGLTVGELKVRL